MPTAQIQIQASVGGVVLPGATISGSDTGALLIQDTIAGSTTNKAVTCAIDQSKLSFLYIQSDVVLTLKTNSSDSPQETIALPAGIPLIWATGAATSIPFAGDVTVIYATNATEGAATLTIAALQDATP